jgi:hypothetical protein
LEKSSTCPFCQSDNITIDQSIVNKTLRLAIQVFIEEEEENKRQQAEMEAMKTDDDIHTGEEEPMDTKEEKTVAISTEVSTLYIFN